MTAALELGAFNLVQPAASTASPWTSKVLTDGTNRGNPVPIEVQVQSWLQDGAIVVTQGYDNREVPVRVKLAADTLLGVGAAEKALFSEIGKPNTLSWTPNVALVAPIVFVVITSKLEHLSESGWDNAEVDQRPSAKYQLSLTCEAFVRSATETVTAALAASGSTTTLVNDGSATTGWTGAVDGVTTAPSVVSGAVGITTAALLGDVTVSLTYTAAITTSSTKYLVVDWKPATPAAGTSLRAFGDGVELTRMAQTQSPTAGYTRTWFGPVAAASIAALRLDSRDTTNFPYATARGFYVDNINRTDIRPTYGSARQLLRSIDVAGSARTRGSIAIEHASSSLGDVLAYFFPDTDATGKAAAYLPALRPFRVSGPAVTTDAAMVSGARENINGATTTFDIPVAGLVNGTHVAMAKAYSSFAGPTSITVSWTAHVRVNGLQQGPIVSGSNTMIFASGAQTIWALGRAQLPTCDVSPTVSNAVVRVTITATAPAAFNLDEVWLFNTSIGQLIFAPCGTAAPSSGGSANRLFIEPPTAAYPRPSVRIGFAADRSDAFYPTGLAAWDQPEFRPPRVNVFTVTTNALDASVTLRHYPRWFANPAA